MAEKGTFKKFSKKSILAVAVAGVSSLFHAQHARAAVYYWDASTSSSWNTASNWSTLAGSNSASVLVPSTADTVTFNTTALNATPEAISLNGSQSVSNMIFNSTGTTTISQGSSGTLTLATGLTLNTGAGLVTISAPLAINGSEAWSAAAGTTLTLSGVLTRNLGATLDFSTTGTFNGAGLIAATTSTLANGWATIGGTNWAINDGTKIIALTNYATATAATTTAAGTTVANYAGKDIDVTSSPVLAGAVTINSIRFNTAAADTFTLTGTNIITSGGILVTSAVGNNLSTITGGTIEGASSKDLVIIQNNTSKGLTIASVIADNTGATGLTKSGLGTLTITNSGNSFTGNITVNQGVLKTGTDTGSQTGVLGNPNTAGRQITIASGATLIFGNHDTFGGWAAAPAVTLNINGTVTNSGPWINVLGTVNFNGGTLAAIDGYNSNGVTAYVLQTGFNVTVAGSTPSSITLSGATNPRLALRGAVTFNVADVTGDANADLIVAAPLSNHPDNTVGSLVKSGTGTMLFNGTVQSTYSGGTTVNAGTLMIDESNISGNANLLLNTGALTLSGGNLTIKGKSGITAAQTFSGITLAAGTVDSITLNANTGTAANLTSTAALVQNAGSTLFLDLSAAGSGAFLTNMTANTAAPWATVKDSGGTGIGTINASKQLVRVTSFTALPASGALSTTDYNLTLNSNTTTAGSLNLIETSSQSANSLTVDTTAGSGTFGLGATVLSTTGVYISGPNTFAVTGTGALGTSGSVLFLHNYNAGLVTLAAPISGAAGGLTVDGTGTTSLTGTSTYTGVTTINSGTLQIGGAGLLNSGSYAGNIIDNGALVEASSANQTLSGSISGAGSLLQSGANTLTLSGANTYTGGTTVNAGTLTLSGSGTLGNTSGSLTVNTGGTLNLNGTSQNVGNLSGTGGTITNNGAAVTLFIGNGNAGGGTYAGSINSGTGTIALDKVGNNTITLSGTSTVAGVQINGATPGDTLELSGTLTSTGGFNWIANGVGGNNNGITNDFGTLQLDNGSLFTVNGSPGDVFIIARTSGTGVLTQNGGTFNYNPGGSNTSFDVSYQGTGTYNMNGGTLNLNGKTLNLDGSTGSGTFNLNGGLVQAVNITASGGTTTFNFNGGTLQASGTAASLLTGITSAFVKSGGAIVDTNNFNATIAQALLDGTGGGGLTKIGAGILTLTGSNTYTGVTNLTAGTLNLGVAETVGTAGPLGKSAAANAGSIFMGGGTLQYSASNNNDYSGRFSTATGQAFNIDTNGQIVTFGTALQGANNTLTKLGTGSLILSGASANTYTGLTTVTNGALILSKTAGVAAISGNLAINGSSSNVWSTANNQLSSNTVVSSVNAVGVASFTLLSSTQTIAGLSSTSGGLMVANTTKSSSTPSPASNGAGTLILTGSGSYADAGWIWDNWDPAIGSNGTVSLIVNMGAGGTQTLSPTSGGMDTYSGGTTINSGTLRLSGSGTLGNTSGSLTVNTGGTLDLNGTSQTVGSLSGTGGTITNSNASVVNLVIGSGNTGGGTFAGAISPGAGTISLYKFGTNTITLSGTSTVNGLQVSSATAGGTLEISGTLTSSATTFNYIGNGGNNNGTANDFGTLQLDSGSLFTVTANGADNFVIGRNSGTGIINQNGGTFNFNPGATFNVLYVSANGTGTYNLNGGTLNLNGKTLNLNVAGGTGTFNLNGGLLQTVNVTASGGTTTFNFNGGTLQASGTAASLLTGVGNAFVKSNGAIVDTNGFNATIAQALLDGTGGGGLTKSGGTGILTLTANSTYTGGTTISAGTLQFTGSGSLYNNGANAGSVVVNNGGTLAFGRSDTFGAANTTTPVTVTVNAGGLVTSNGLYTTLPTLILNGGELRANGGLTTGFDAYQLQSVTVGGSSASSITATGAAFSIISLTNTIGANATFNVADATGDANADLTVSAPLQNEQGAAGGNNGLIKSGTGTMFLSALNTYTGGTTINNGKLVLSGTGSINASSGITINGAGAGFVQISSTASTPAVTLTQGLIDGTGTVGNVTVANLSANVVAGGNGGIGTLTTANLTFSGAATINLIDANLLNPAPNLSVSTLTLNAGTVTLNAGGSWNLGNNKLIGYTATSGLTLNTNLVLGAVTGTTPRQSITGLAINGSEIDLVIAGNVPAWSGAASSSWSTATLGGPTNWQLNLAPYGNTNFLTNDDAIFGETAGTLTVANFTVNIDSGDVSPHSVTFANNTNNYTINGPNGIAAGKLSLTGSGTVTLTNANSYTGGTTIANGKLILTGSLSSAGGLIIGGGTTSGILQLGAGSTANNQTFASLATAGSGNANAIVGGASAVSTLTIANTTATTYGGVLGGAGTNQNNLALVMAGTGTLTLNNTGSTFTGDIMVNQGDLLAGGGTGALGNPNTVGRQINVASAGTLTFGHSDTFGTWLATPAVTLNINGTVNSNGGNVTALGVVNFNGGTLAATSGFNLNGITAYVLSNGYNVNVTGSTPSTISVSGASVALNGAVTFNVADVTGNANADLIVAAALSNHPSGAVGGLLKTGLGTMQISSAGSYTGGTTVNAGILQLSGAGTLGNTSGSLTVNTGGTLDVNNTTQNVGNLSGTGGTITNSTAGAVNFFIGNGNNGGGTFAGNITPGAGSIALIKNGTGTITLSGTGNSVIGLAANVGTLDLTGTLTTTGSNNVVYVGNGGTGGSANTTGTLVIDNNASLSVTGTYGDAMVLGRDSGSGTLTQNAGSSFNYNPSNQAYLFVAASNSAATNSVYNMNGGTLNMNSKNLVVGYGNLAAATGTLNVATGATISNVATLYVGMGRGLATVNQTGGSIAVGNTLPVQLGSNLFNDSINAQSTYNLNGGTLTAPGIAKGSTSAGSTATFNFNGGTLQANATSATFITGLTTANVRNGGAIIDTNGNTITIGQSLLHSTIGGDNATDGGLTKIGAGTLTLTAANTYTGTTTITSGKVTLSSTGSIANSQLIIVGDSVADNAAKFDVSAVSGGFILGSAQTLGGHGTIIGNVTTTSGSTLSPGNTVGMTTYNNNLTIASGTLLKFEFNSSPANDQIVVAGSLTLNGGAFNLLAEGTSTPWSTAGTYKLINYSGTLGGTGISTLVVSNAQPGKSYSFSTTTDANWIDLFINTRGSSSWNGAGANQNWYNSANWVGAIVSGANDGTTVNTDTATFNAVPTVTGNGTSSPVVVDANRNVQSIVFDTAADSYTIGTNGGNALLLTNGGSITLASTFSGTAKSETVAAPLMLEGANGAYAFSNNSTSASNVLIISGGITGGAVGNTTLTLNGSNTGANTISGVIGNGAASISVYKDGPGTWILPSANTYNSGTTINAGTLQTGNSGALGTVGVTFSSGSGTLALAATGGSQTYSNTIDATNGGNISISGALAATVGDVTVGAGDIDQVTNTTLTLTSPDTSGNSYSLTVGVLNLNSLQTINVANSAGSGAGQLIVNGGLNDLQGGTNFVTLTKTGAGTLTIAADSTIADGEQLVINQGVVLANSTNALGTSGFSLLATISTGGTLSLGGSGSAVNVAALADGTGSGSVLLNGKILQLGNTLNTNYSSFSGVIADGSATGGLAVSGSNFTQNLAGQSTYTGPTTISGSDTLQIGVANALPTTTDLTITGGFSTFDLNNNNQTVHTLNGSGNVNNSGGAATFTVSNGGTFSGAINNAIALNVSGGTLALTEANTYSGGTTIAIGATLLANNTSGSATGSGAVSVSGTLSGSGALQGAVTINSSGHMAPGNGGVGTMAINSLTLASGSVLDFEFNTNPANDFISVANSGGLALNGGGFNLYQEGTTNAFGAVGTYHLIGYTGSFSGSVSNLSVLNPLGADGYTFVNNTSLHEIDLTITGPANFSIPNPVNVNVLLHGNAAAVVTNDGGATGSYNTSNASGLSIVSGGSGSLASGNSGRIVLAFAGNNVYGGTSSGSFTITNANPGLSANTENVTVNATYGTATANNTDYDYTHSTTSIPSASQLSHNLNANNDPLFLATNALTADVTAGAPYDGLSSTVTGTTNGGGHVGTTATILKGNAGVAQTVTMNWRNRSASETRPTQTVGPMAHPNEFLISDVVLVTGMGLNGDNSSLHVQTDIFALSMSYLPSDLPGNETTVANSGGLYLGWLSPATNTWLNAVAGDFAGMSVSEGFQGAEAFSTYFNNNGNLSNDLGAWGVDTTNHTVWAVLDHNSEFGVVVPEPTSLGLLGLGALGLLGRKRRKSRAQVSINSMPN